MAERSEEEVAEYREKTRNRIRALRAARKRGGINVYHVFFRKW